MDDMGFLFNKFYIFDFTSEKDAQTGLFIKNTLIDSLNKVGRSNSVVHYPCAEPKDFFNAILNLFEEMLGKFNTSEMVYPYVHIEGHGSKKGLELEKGFIDNQKLSDCLRLINLLSKNNLTVSIAACFSVNVLMKTKIIEDRLPFFCFIAPVKEIKVNEIENFYGAYFKQLVESKDFLQALKILKDSGKIYFEIMPFFIENLLKKHMRSVLVGKSKTMQVEEYTTELLNCMPHLTPNTARSIVKEKYKSPLFFALFFQNFFNHAVMVDVFPSEERRFSCNFSDYQAQLKSEAQ
jgi:hypothetical protein